MSDQSFTTTFSVDQDPRDVFDAVTDVRGWWSQEVEGDTDTVGGEFTYQYQDVHRCRIRVTELVPGRTVAWRVLENHFSFTQDTTEWTDTTITFDISARDGGTELRFTHHGLTPADECYDACRQGWTNYIGSSLRDLITTGKGHPNGTGAAQTAAEQELTAGR